jgi:3-hydroxyacyl-[acyl-carrier-protein] dehydratase
MAQTAGAVVIAQDENYADTTKNVLFMAIDGVKFRKQVNPGDQLRMHVERIKARRNIFVFKAVAMVDEQVACEAELTAMIVG